MLLLENIDLSELSTKGKNFNWKKPDKCLKCNCYNLWGHGYSARYFHQFSCVLYLKRYLCPNCGMSLTIKPTGYWRNYTISVNKIYTFLKFRLINRRWEGLSRQRGGHWLRKLLQKIRMMFGNEADPVSELERFYQKSIHFFV